MGKFCNKKPWQCRDAVVSVKFTLLRLIDHEHVVKEIPISNIFCTSSALREASSSVDIDIGYRNSLISRNFLYSVIFRRLSMEIKSKGVVSIHTMATCEMINPGHAVQMQIVKIVCGRTLLDPHRSWSVKTKDTCVFQYRVNQRAVKCLSYVWIIKFPSPSNEVLFRMGTVSYSVNVLFVDVWNQPQV